MKAMKTVLNQTLYQTDYQVWVTETVNHLRAGNFAGLELEALIEEVESLGRSERRGIVSQLTRLLLHLLKWQFQPQRRSDSWLDSITDARTQIELALTDSPSLKNYPTEQLANCYQWARRQAATQTKIEISVFPEICPYSLELVLTENWLPES